MLAKHLINLASFDALPAALQRNQLTFMDAYAGVILETTLSTLDPGIFTKQYPELTFMNAGIQADNSGGYANKVQSLRTLPTGRFHGALDRSDNKGRISLMGEMSSIDIIERQAFIEWTDTELKQADMQGMNLVQALIEAALQAYNMEVDEAGLVGLSEGGPASGILNSSAWSTAAASSPLDAMSASDFYAAVAGHINAQRNAVKNTPAYVGNVYIMPTELENYADTLVFNSASSPDTVMGALRKNFPNVKFMSSFRADALGVNLFFSNSGQVLKMRLPVPMLVGEIFNYGSFNKRADIKYRIGGADILESTGGRLLTSVLT